MSAGEGFIMTELLEAAVGKVRNGKQAYCKFLSANDTGITGAHQAGIYFAKPASSILFDDPGIRGSNKERRVAIDWHNGSKTNSRCIYYGTGTRNEYRLTNFGRGFEYLRPDHTGSLFILVKDKENPEHYYGFCLDSDEDIEGFLETFSLSPTETNQLIKIQPETSEDLEGIEIENFIKSLDTDFPQSDYMSAEARRIQDKVYDHREYIRTDPDIKIIKWTETEFRLFRALEAARYGEVITHGFQNIDDFIALANTVLNRRKSRAGKSLEHNLAAVFDANDIRYTPQGVTEGKKRPDFLFPSADAYSDLLFPADKLLSLAAKTTCKDRWRQIITEGNRFIGRTKYLCTLQQGNTEAQLEEMRQEQVTLVVPAPYIKTYPPEYQQDILTIKQFVERVKASQS